MMMEIARPRKRLGRTCSIGVCAKHRIEQREQQEPGEEATDMRLPGDARAIGTERNEAKARDGEDQVGDEPHGEKGEHARIAQRLRQ